SRFPWFCSQTIVIIRLQSSSTPEGKKRRLNLITTYQQRTAKPDIKKHTKTTPVTLMMSIGRNPSSNNIEKQITALL
ncbi:MAG TPA: hypothetical protein VLH35_01080, partial [Candidatus Acidoferrales bacterium]|nr:hypothetical protein [Candidatus Acidoferrales bacterium]